MKFVAVKENGDEYLSIDDQEGQVAPPLSHRVYGLICRFCNDSHLIASHSIDETAALDDSLRSDKHQVNLVHDVCNSRVEHHSARDSG